MTSEMQWKTAEQQEISLNEHEGPCNTIPAVSQKVGKMIMSSGYLQLHKKFKTFKGIVRPV